MRIFGGPYLTAPPQTPDLDPPLHKARVFNRNEEIAVLSYLRQWGFPNMKWFKLPPTLYHSALITSVWRGALRHPPLRL